MGQRTLLPESQTVRGGTPTVVDCRLRRRSESDRREFPFGSGEDGGKGYTRTSLPMREGELFAREF